MPNDQLSLKLHNWWAPVEVDLATGRISGDYDQLHHDQYRKSFEQFMQEYAIEVIHEQAAGQGLTVSRTELEDGSVELTVCEW